MRKTKQILVILRTAVPQCVFIFLWLFILLISCHPLLAQGESPRIRHFTAEDGLSQAIVNDLLKDSIGFVWMATEDGLNRFDGREFKHFKYRESDTSSISGNILNKLHLDNKGNIWVGTIGNGLNYYDRNTDKFNRVRLKYADATETISGITSDDDGNIWVTTRTSGLHRLKPAGEGTFTQKNILPNQRLGAISKDQSGKLWIGGFGGEVYTLNSSVNTAFQARLEIQVQGYVQAFYHAEKSLLIGCDFGLFIYDLQNKQVRLFELEKEENHPTKHVLAFLKEDESRVWIGTGNGMYLMDLSIMEVVKKITYEEDGIGGLSTSTVQSLLRLSPHQILAGTAAYINLIDFSRPYFKNISKNKQGQHLLNDNVVFSILKDREDLWIGTADGGLNLIRGETTYHFLEDLNDPESITGSAVLDIAKDSVNNRLWLATTRGLSMIDLAIFDPDNPTFSIFHYDEDNPYSINMDYVTSVTLDNNGIVWGGTYGNGIFRMENSEDDKFRFILYKRESNIENTLINDFIHCIRTDNDNNVWIGSEGGLTRIYFLRDDYHNVTFKHFTKTPDREKFLSHNSVLDILVDSKNRIWVATRRGFNLYLGNDAFQSWTEEKQFPNAVVYGLQDDESGHLWMGTNDGIVNFNPENKIFKRYGLEDGIQGSEFNIGARFRDSGGHIYLGGIGGVTYFHPDDLEKIDQPKPIYFSQLRVKDEIISTQNSKDNLLKQSLLKTNRLEFKHNQFPFYLKFSSIDFRLNKNVEYGYKLLPTDEEWNMLTDPEIQFLNLPSGNYSLLINGFSRGVEWEQSPLKMELRILPPLWTTWWAYMIYICVAALLAYWFYRFQLSRKLAVAESSRLKEVNQLKSSLYTNITHEFRTPITVILGMAESARSEVEDKGLNSVEKSLEMIRRNGKNLLRLVNELLDLARLESGNLKLQPVQADVISFVKYICESFQSLARESQIDLVVYSEIDALTMDFDSHKLSTVIVNLLTNAIKFTLPGGKIVVHLNRVLKRKTEYLFLRVKDNGVGISKQAIPHIFDRFYQEDDSAVRQHEGTGIGLALTKELIELMKGTIELRSELGKGSEFDIQIPITRNAVRQRIDTDPIPAVQMSITPQRNSSFEKYLDDESGLPLVLIIEDNVDVVHYLKTCLAGKYESIHAADGILGIEAAFERIPDIIICDVMMPGKDGYEVCSVLKADERTDHIPIIMLTAKATMQDRITGLSHGADAYLAKPFNIVELFTRLDQLILLRKKMMEKMQEGSFNKLLRQRVENPEIKFIQKTVKIIHEDIDHHLMGSAFLSRKLALSESQLYRKLKAITDKSTGLFIRSVRLQMAKEMIQTTDKTMSEVAYAVGFNDPSWFSRHLKRSLDILPVSW